MKKRTPEPEEVRLPKRNSQWARSLSSHELITIRKGWATTPWDNRSQREVQKEIRRRDRRRAKRGENALADTY